MNVYKITYDTITEIPKFHPFSRTVVMTTEMVITPMVMLVAAPRFSIPYFEGVVNPKISKAELYDEDVPVNEGRIWNSEEDYKDEFYEGAYFNGSKEPF